MNEMNQMFFIVLWIQIIIRENVKTALFYLYKRNNMVIKKLSLSMGTGNPILAFLLIQQWEKVDVNIKKPRLLVDSENNIE